MSGLKKEKNRYSRGASLHLFLALLFLFVSGAPFIAPAYGQGAAQPKLVVMIVADQFAYSYLNRYRDKFVAGGLRQLMDQGANFTNCRYDNMATRSAVGYSTISTGAHPWASGIVGDTWYSRSKKKAQSAVEDSSLQMVGANGTGASTRYLQGTTFGDQVKLATNGRSRLISISLKDTASLLLGGRLANEAIWWDNKSGNFVTSSQYGHDLPSWATSFNDQHYADKYFGKPWQRLYPETEYKASTRDDYPFERPLGGDGRQFPHVITGGAGGPSEAFYNAFAATPWANQMVFDLSREAVEREFLGQHTDTDVLAIGLSAGGNLGDAFGPYSQEMEDLVLRMDQNLAGFMQYLDQKLGLSNCLIVFTSDRGVAPIPDFAKERGLDAGRIDPTVFKTLLNSALSSRLGNDEWIEEFEPPNLYLNLGSIDKEKYRQPDVEALAAKMAHSIPGIGDVYTAAQFFTNDLPSGPLTTAARKSYYWGRSGELIVAPKPHWVFAAETSGTASGSPYSYDTQVPLILLGYGIAAGRYDRSVSPADIAPTVSGILGVEGPALCEGSALTEGLRQTGRR